jgi:methylmalonyl-CoA mutase cobalamin-binding domain/chain
VQNDVLKEYIARGTYIYPPEPSLNLIAEMFRFCAEEVPQWNPISISGYHIREAGATAVQEVAFTFANAMEYVRRAVEAGLAVDAFAPRPVVLLRGAQRPVRGGREVPRGAPAVRALMRERFGASTRARGLRFHTQTGGVTLQAQQPLNNVVRVTGAGARRVLGGTQSLHTNGYDEALALPDGRGGDARAATQQVLAYESGTAQTVDPLAGSYYVESLTNELEARALALLERVDAMGGAPRRSSGASSRRRSRAAPTSTSCASRRGDGGRRGQPVRRRRGPAGDPGARLLRARALAGGVARRGAAAARRRGGGARARRTAGGRRAVRRARGGAARADAARDRRGAGAGVGR